MAGPLSLRWISRPYEAQRCSAIWSSPGRPAPTKTPSDRACNREPADAAMHTPRRPLRFRRARRRCFRKFCRAAAASWRLVAEALAQARELKPQRAPERLSTRPVAATVLREAVGLTSPVLVATALYSESERERKELPESAPHLPAATHHLPAATHQLPAERPRDRLKQAAPERQAPAPMNSRLQDSPRRRCRTANRQLRARVLADKSALVRWWP